MDPSKFGLNHVTVVHVTLVQTSDNSLDTFNSAIQQIAEVESCLMIAGQFDYMLAVMKTVKDTSSIPTQSVQN